MVDPKDLIKISNLIENKLNCNSLFLPPRLPDEEYVLRTQKQKIKHKLPPFVAHAGGKYMRNAENSLLHKIGKMNAAERWFFLYVDKRLNFDTNVAIVRNSELTSTQIGYKTKAYKSLYKANLIKRVKREHYMINPDVIIPIEVYPIVKKTWDSLQN